MITKNLRVGVGEFVKGRRRRAVNPDTGSTYERDEFARKVGWTYKNMEALENGRIQSLGPTDASRFATALGCMVSDILTAMGYAVERPDLTALESELVSLARRLPEEIRDSFLEAARGDAIAALRLYERLRQPPSTAPGEPTPPTDRASG